MQSTVERAFELARSGEYKTVYDVERQLRRELYEQVEQHLHGYQLRRQLLAAIKGTSSKEVEPMQDPKLATHEHSVSAIRH